MKLLNLLNFTKLIELSSIIALLLIPFFVSKLWAIIPMIGIIFANIIQFLREKKNKKKFRRKFIEKLLKYLHKTGNFRSINNARCTYHIIPKGKKFKQFVNYYPTHTGINRENPLGKGIIGHSYEYKKCFVENFFDDKEYRNNMINKYKYTEEEMQMRRTDRRSYFSYPILDGQNNIFGIFFFDASKYNLFQDIECKLVRNLIEYLDMIKDDVIEIQKNDWNN